MSTCDGASLLHVTCECQTFRSPLREIHNELLRRKRAEITHHKHVKLYIYLHAIPIDPMRSLVKRFFISFYDVSTFDGMPMKVFSFTLSCFECLWSSRIVRGAFWVFDFCEQQNEEVFWMKRRENWCENETKRKIHPKRSRHSWFVSRSSRVGERKDSWSR